MPEVALVAVLDADKEGFLRSAGSLIQTMGRAARNERGRVILYGETVTGSMQRAMAETERRRAHQLAYNIAHGVVPRSVIKPVADVMEGARSDAATDRRAGHGSKGTRRTVVTPVPRNLADLARETARLEQQMYQHARNLEFEQAAGLRDRLETLRQLELELGSGAAPAAETRLKSAL